MHPAPTEGLPQWPMILRHLKIGWWMLLGFVSCGIALEAMHGFKMDIYLNVDHQTRRTMWTLMHGFGAILGLAHIAFAASLPIAHAPESPPDESGGASSSSAAIASACLKSASILLPTAFFLGGLSSSGQTMPLGLLLAAPGIMLLLIAAGLTAIHVRRDH